MSLLPETNTLDTAAHLAALKAEEAAAPVVVPDGFEAALAFVQVQGYGTPGLAGAAYLAACTMAGRVPDGSGESAGVGKAGVIKLADPNDVIGLAREVATKTGVPFVIPARVIPADAPLSNPALAADPVPGYGEPRQEPVASPVAPVVVNNTANATTLGGAASPQQEAPAQGGSALLQKCVEAAGTGKWGPLKKPEIAEGFTELLSLKESTVPAIAVAPIVAGEADAVGPGGCVQIFIDCTAAGATDLAPWVKQFTDLLCKEYGCSDVRMADSKTPLGYGGWKGAIAVCVAKSFATLAPGAYTLDTRGNELHEAAAAGFEASQITARGLR